MASRKTPDPILAGNIKKYRIQKGLTQKELAENLNYKNVDTVKQWERPTAKSSPDLQTLKRMCDLFDCSLADLIGKESEYEMYEAHASSDIDDLLKKSKAIINYLESIGYSIDLFPRTASFPDSIRYEYRISRKGSDVRCFDQDEWGQFEKKLSTMVKMLLE